jgi:DNA invertase Pin-like site-specific DNA recombinase
LVSYAQPTTPVPKKPYRELVAAAKTPLAFTIHQKCAISFLTNNRRPPVKQYWEVIAVYTDTSASGNNLDRPQFREMMRDVAKFDALIVHRLDRLARSVDLLASILRVLAAANIQLVSLDLLS